MTRRPKPNVAAEPHGGEAEIFQLREGIRRMRTDPTERIRIMSIAVDATVDEYPDQVALGSQAPDERALSSLGDVLDGQHRMLAIEHLNRRSSLVELCKSDGAALWPEPATEWSETAAARKAEDEAFSFFYRGHFAKLVAFLLYRGAPRREAEDLAQETMRRAYLNWDTIQEPMDWVLKDASRALGRWTFRTREEPSESAFDDAPLHAGHGSDDWLDVNDLLAFLKTLPYRQRQVMSWMLLEYKPHEIAEILKISPDAVRGSLLETRKKCREWWNQREEDRGEDSPEGRTGDGAV